MIEGPTYPVNDSPIHGKHDGLNFSPVHQSVCKLQPFYFHILAVQIHFSVVAAL